MKNRQLSLLIYLLEQKKSTYKELAKHFEVSTKTIERDVDRLSSAGIPVYCQQGSGGGVYLDENFKFSTSFFAPEDIAHMIAALHIAKSFTANPQNQEILQKLSLISPNLTKMFARDVQHYFNLDLYDAPVDFSQGIFCEINRCLDFKLYTQIDDRGAVVCLGYVFKPDGIYLFAHTNDYILVKIDQIKTFVPSTEICEEKLLSYQEYKKTFGN